MLRSFKSEEVSDELDIQILKSNFKLQRRFENKDLRVWLDDQGSGLVAVRSPRTLLVSMFTDKNNQCIRNNQYQADNKLTKKN